MNIAYVVPEFVTENSGGGLASYINNISHILARKGHNITIIVKSSDNESIKYAENIYLERVSIDESKVDITIPGSIYEAWSVALNDRLKEVAENARIDVVQYANWFALGYHRTNIPTVVRISSDLPSWRAANTLEYRIGHNYNCEKATDILEDLALMKADQVFSPSIMWASRLSERTGKEIAVIESPFDIQNVEEDDSVYKEMLYKKEYLFTYGNLNLLKGSKLVGDNIHDLLEQNKEIYYVLAGNNNGWKDNENHWISAVDYIKENAKEHKERVIYLGALKRNILYPIIRNSKVCIFPSRVDNLPNACIEAMHLGGIIIGTRGASFEQLIVDQENGFLINIDDGKSLQLAVRKALELSNEERTMFCEKSYERITEMDADLVGKQVIQFYQQTIQKKKSLYNSMYYTEIEQKLQSMRDGKKYVDFDNSSNL